MNIKLISVTFFCFTVFLSCTQDRVYTEEIMEIHTVDAGEKENKIGALLFSESELYSPDNKLEQKFQYNSDKSLKGVERFQVKKLNNTPERSAFYDGQDSLLSYYKMLYKDDKLIRKIGFDAANDAMLRIEEFDYDTDGNRIAKYLRSSDNFLQREYNFTFDKDGNEKSVTTKDGSGKIVMQEYFNITEKDKEGNWLEKWGFVDDKPVRYYIKSRRILKKKSE